MAELDGQTPARRPTGNIKALTTDGSIMGPAAKVCGCRIHWNHDDCIPPEDAEGGVCSMGSKGGDVKLTGNDKDGALDKILGRGSDPKNK